MKVLQDMSLIFEDNNKRTIKIKEEIRFSSFSSYHLIIITTRAKSEKQLSQEATDDEDLKIKIDNKTFPVDSPAAFSGGKLHNLAKTIYFLIFLKGKDHEIILETDNPPGTAKFENLQIYALNLVEKLVLEPNIQAEDGDRRPWLTFVLDNLSLKSIIPTIIYSRRKRDSDDVKIKIDGERQRNLLQTIKHFFWRFAGSFLPWSSPTKTETQIFTVNFPEKLHYIEFDADRMPILNNFVINFGKDPSIPAGIPTVDNPEWTGNFYDDTENILLSRLLLGEAENEPKETKIWIAGSILNRVKAKAWPNTVHGVILQPNQYDPFKTSDLNFNKITSPLKDTINSQRKNEWQECYEAAREILSEKTENSTEATHFHGLGVSKEWFLKNVIPNGKFIKKIGNTYFYWSPN